MSIILAPLGWLYGGVMQLRRWLYQRHVLTSHQLPGLVISVGNLEAGGTGKSPVVMALAQHLLKSGARPAILTRGYRSGLKPDDSAVMVGSNVAIPPQSGVSFHADEATMQARTLAQVPIIIGAQRWAAAQRYLETHSAPTHWILDDGFQHLKLRRQLDIVLLDAENPWHNGRCLPAGRLREFPSTLQYAQLILLTRAQLSKPRIMVQNMTAPVIPVIFGNGPPRQLAGPERPWPLQTSVALALGIAHPQRVIDHCHQQHYPITEQLLTRDHELFPREKLTALANKSGAILTTEKDFWRQAETLESLKIPIYVVPLELRFPDSFDLSNILAPFTVSL
ncbi:MAG TPA: tetraacyldisaccharide 4'-kinase [Oligoflexus sp.]|uniref:tetraacyldisaccharide 4'-kinase n=1 Tax=Oligoflexus sp. TaxID=1971216 RepID=UPI002D477209|nr:tetraacyldisaccharide 4'-kinase [Oligoflexus sp.]HYX36021.1 tetraacyldisaccharide 4'-kinase [Oligoflexus sp.]